MNDKEKLRELFERQFSNLCPKCEGTRWVVEDGLARRCDCFLEELNQRRIEFARIPLSYQHCQLTNFRPQNPSQKDALTLARAYVSDFLSSKNIGKGILFRGSIGVGKTHLAVAILNALLEQGFTGTFINFVHLIEKIKQSYEPGVEVAEPELFRQLKRCHVVVMDELGATRPTEFVFDKLYDIINYCFDHKISLIFTTNYQDRIETHRNDGLESRPVRTHSLGERINERLRSRILERCFDVCLEGDDYRLRKHR